MAFLFLHVHLHFLHLVKLHDLFKDERDKMVDRIMAERAEDFGRFKRGELLAKMELDKAAALTEDDEPEWDQVGV